MNHDLPALDDDRWGWKQEGRDLMRAVAGGAIIGMPLLYTMEMWSSGLVLSSRHLLMVLGVILVLNFAFDLLSGFREKSSVGSALFESITSLGIGIVFSIIVLGLLGELQADATPLEIAGKILVQACAVSVGVSFANSQVGQHSRTGDEEEEEPGDASALQLRADLRDIGATIAGATVFALNVAPTEEIVLVASRLSPLQQLALLGFSILLCWLILYASGFEDQKVYVPSLFQKAWPETLMACAVSFTVAGLLLVLFGQRELVSEPQLFIAGVIALGLPAVVGGAAGRLIT